MMLSHIAYFKSKLNKIGQMFGTFLNSKAKVCVRELRIRRSIICRDFL